MGRFLVMQESRVLLDEPLGCEPLGLKLCVDRQIVKEPTAFHWSQECHRWETHSEVRFEHAPQTPLELELFLTRGRSPTVICEATVSPAILHRHLNEEVKILLSYDGLVKGWLYCYFSLEEKDEDSSTDSEKYLSLQKINLAFLEELEEQITIKIKQNGQLIFEKEFRLNQRSKTLFPNLKKSVRLSDVFRIEIQLQSFEVRPIMFLIDHIKRGKNTTFESWLRNKHKNRVGNMFIEYYMENLFLQNERQLRTRKAIHPDSLEYAKTIAAKKINEREAEGVVERKGQESIMKIKQKLEEADQRICKINNSVSLMMLEIRNNEVALPVKKTKATFSYTKLADQTGRKENLAFCCQEQDG